MTIALITHPAYSDAFAGRQRLPMEKFKFLYIYPKEKGLPWKALLRYFNFAVIEKKSTI